MIIRRVLFVIIFLFLFVGSFVFYTNKAFLYSGIPTHYNLTQEIIELYNLTYDPDITLRQAELIIKGSVDEDTLPRPAFHFYDPIYNRAPLGVYTAKKWALDSNAQTPFYLRIAALKKLFTGIFLYHGDYSWPASINSFVKNDLDEAYYGLGHILHLIEDMDVPAHTRNDHHILGDPLEQWARDSTIPKDYDWAGKLYNQGYYPKYLYSLEQAFDELAQYSNKYFFSSDSILSSDYSWPKIVKEKSEDYGPYIQRTYAWGEDENGRLFRLAFVDHYKTNWDRAFRGLGEQKYVFSLDRDDYNLNHGYWERLAPKAIIYGAGVIRLFMKDIEWEKERLAQKGPEPSFFQKAQTFVKNILGIREEDKKEETEVIPPLEPRPLPEPGRLPKIETVIIQTPVLDTKDKPIETPLGQEEKKASEDLIDKEQEVEVSEEKQEEVKYGGSVSGSSSGGTPREEEQQPEEKQGEELEPHIIINEIAWMGTTSSSYDEWIELHNTSDQEIDLTDWVLEAADSTLTINLIATISADGYFLLERTDDETISNILADQTYTGTLNNSGENLFLKDSQGNVIDQVDCSESWYTGNDEEKRTMERINPDESGTDPENWQTYTGLGSSAIDVGGNPILGTPKAQNSSGVVEEPEEEEQEEEEEEQSTNHLVINEVAWMGTKADDSDEWIELYNRANYGIDLTDWVLESPDGTPSISLTASISAHGYFLLERTNDEVISNITTDQIYTGALTNDGEDLILKDNNENIIDQVNCSIGWYAGENEKQEEEWVRKTMERINPDEPGTDPENWQTYTGFGSSAIDFDGNPIFGTPKTQNSVYDSTINNPPSSITDLAISYSHSTFLILQWTAPSDESVSISLSYNIRYSTEDITESNWSSANQIPDIPSVDNPGISQDLNVSGLTFNTIYYFALKTFDGLNFSELSNVISYSIGPPPVLADSPWPVFQRDVGHTGLSSYQGPGFIASSSVNIRWTLDLGSNAQASPVIGPDNTIYVGTVFGVFYAINHRDGTIKWTYDVFNYDLNRGGIYHSSALASDGTIYFSAYGYSYLYALTPDGYLKWKYKVGGPNDSSSSPIIGSDGTIYLTDCDGYLHAINPDGTLKWKIHIDGAHNLSGPALGPDGIIYIAWGGFLYTGYLGAVNPDGSLKWTSENINASAGETLTLSSNNIIYIGSYLGLGSPPFRAINSEGGSVIWLYPLGNNFTSAAVSPDNIIYVSNERRKLCAIDSDGTLVWSFSAEDEIKGSPAVDSQGVVYFGADDKKVYAINPDGSLKWDYELDDRVRASVIIGHDGTIYAVSYSGKLYAIGE